MPEMMKVLRRRKDGMIFAFSETAWYFDQKPDDSVNPGPNLLEIHEIEVATAEERRAAQLAAEAKEKMDAHTALMKDMDLLKPAPLVAETQSVASAASVASETKTPQPAQGGGDSPVFTQEPQAEPERVTSIADVDRAAILAMDETQLYAFAAEESLNLGKLAKNPSLEALRASVLNAATIAAVAAAKG